MDRVNISNITMDNVKGTAISIRLGNRADPQLAIEKEKGHNINRTITVSRDNIFRTLYRINQYKRRIIR
jgi:hypothetical protein